MAAPLDNSFWKLAGDNIGRNKTYTESSQLWDDACRYFEWVEENPLSEEKIFHYQGETVKDVVYKMRAMTLGGLCLHMGIDRKTFDHYGSKEGYEEFFPIVTRIREVIAEQKFTGAAADLLNPNIIARDLGLADKKDITTQGESIKSFGDFYSDNETKS